MWNLNGNTTSYHCQKNKVRNRLVVSGFVSPADEEEYSSSSFNYLTTATQAEIFIDEGGLKNSWGISPNKIIMIPDQL